MIVFKNKGLIDIRAIKTMGVSVKAEDSIGYFGTGLKYALAVLLREGQSVTIYRGKEKYEFTAVDQEIRGQTFGIVTMNGEELAFTTDLGKNWKLWQAYRELHCNAQDESGTTKRQNTRGKLNEESTTITVQGREFEEVHEHRHKYFISGKPDIETETVDIFLKPSSAIFYKGVNVKESGPYGVTYNVKKRIDLTEDRTALYDFQLKDAVARGVTSCKDEAFIERILTAGAMTFEASLDFDVNEAPGKTFIAVCRRLQENFTPDTNQHAIKYARKHESFDDPIKDIELNEVQKAMLERATRLLDKGGYRIEGFKVRCVETLGFHVSGLAKEGTIFVTIRSFEKGTKELALTLLEEYWHLKHGIRDETREMQNYLFDQIGTLVERLNGEAF